MAQATHMDGGLDAPLEDLQGPLRLPEDRTVVTTLEAARRVLAEPKGRAFHVVGAEGSAPALLARSLSSASDGPVLYVLPDADQARRAAADLRFLQDGLPFSADHRAPLANAGTLLLIPSETSPYADVHADRRAMLARLAALYRLASGEPWRFLVTTAGAFVRRYVPAKVLCDAAVVIRKDSEIRLERVIAQLGASGYLRVPVVEDPGSFAVRGALLDVWPPTTELPVRVELYGDLVLGLKSFDPEDQRTLDELSGVQLPPARESITSEPYAERARAIVRSLCDSVNLPSTRTRALVEDVATGRAFFGAEAFLPAFYPLDSLFSYLPNDAAVVVEDPLRVVEAVRDELVRGEQAAGARQGHPMFELHSLYASEDEVLSALAARHVAVAHRAAIAGGGGVGLDALAEAPIDAPTLATRDQSDLGRAVRAARAAGGKAQTLEPLVRRIQAWREAGLAVAITARGTTQAERLGALLSHRGIDPSADIVHLLVGSLARGTIAPAEGFALVTEEEIFGQRAHRRRERTRSARALLEDLRALEPGDHVVHVDHGVGRYLGLERKLIGGVGVDLLVVEYGGGDKLFLPIYRLNQIQKYSGGEGAPRLDRLGGQSFAKTKARVQRRVRQMADELLKLYAERSALKKQPLAARDDDYAAFEASFPFEETRDQASAIEDVMRDLENPRVMDRLVCGDVGFGKTEVALRAAFRTAVAGRQVALLCPTTVLAQQHFLTFTTRLADYPLVVRSLSRFSTKAEQQDTIKRLKNGGVDVVIGTHRLLSKDVHFKDLGLLIVDEEQRFGVTHKERIKQIRASVDVLTLSATPIPRTLQLAVGGLRDMSIIGTAPVDRRAIRTITSRFDENLVREAIERELGRGGQVFYVYNRIEGIHERAHRVQALVPGARVAVGHGQMSEAALEKTMLDFVAGEYDVLCATAIIESGLDIPRANTIIIDRADLFGLSQLYQLRGRVGRSSERAYCYLIVPPPNEMTDEARMRIEALERYTELGSGFHVATLDMELRGAGDLLGAEQSGFVASVGFELFCQMLEEATHELRGEPVVATVEPELSFDVEALLPEEYVSDVGLRLSFYKRLASAVDDAGVAEIAAELEDRFGQPPVEARHLVELMRIKAELRRLRVLGCEASAKTVTLHLRDDTPLDPVKIGALVGRKRSQYKLTPDARLMRRAEESERFPDGLAHADKMLDELAACVRAEAT